MDRNEDLDSALSFVIGRIEEQGKLSGEPLSGEQRLLLDYLPSLAPGTWDPGNPELVPRNINLEQVCALGKAAYQQDRQSNPGSLNWDFAFAVYTLNRHPMDGLLQSAGMKLRRPRWDGLRLIVTALLPIAAVILLVWNADEGLLWSVGIGSECVAILLLMLFASRRLEKQ